MPDEATIFEKVIGSSELGNGLGAVGLLFSVATFIYGEEKPDATAQALKDIKDELDKQRELLEDTRSLVETVLNSVEIGQVKADAQNAIGRINSLFKEVFLPWSARGTATEEQGWKLYDPKKQNTGPVQTADDVDATYSLGREIAERCEGYLADIDAIINGDGDKATAGNLFELMADRFFQQNNWERTTSVCEKLYRFVDYMRVVQVRGLLCLKAVGAGSRKSYATHYSDLVKKLKSQGEYFDSKVRNDYLKRNVHTPLAGEDCPDFTWFGLKDADGNNPNFAFWNRSRQDENDQKYINNGVNNPRPGEVITGAGFVRDGVGNRAAPNVKSGKPDGSGRIVQSDNALIKPEWGGDDKKETSGGSGEFITGFIDFTWQHDDNSPNFDDGRSFHQSNIRMYGGKVELNEGQVLTRYGLELFYHYGNDREFEIYPALQYAFLKTDGTLDREWYFDWKGAVGHKHEVFFISQADNEDSRRMATNFVGGTDGVITGVIVYPQWTEHWAVMALENKFNLNNFKFNIGSAIDGKTPEEISKLFSDAHPA